MLEPTTIAVLDSSFSGRAARFPQVAERLIARALARSRTLAVNMAIVHQPPVDVRVHMLLWNLAARWGRVRSDGVSLPLNLTHALLADLIAPQRPTVSTAVADLARRGLPRQADTGWLLLGEPPRELLGVSRPVSRLRVAGSRGA